MSGTLPKVMQKVITITNPREPFIPAAHIIAFGRVREASLISSDMWAAESAPIKVYTGERRPTMKANPVVGQPPRFKNCVNTSEGELRGAKTQRGIRTAKKPNRCITSTTFSTMGSFLARNVLNMMQNTVMAMIRRVPCQFLNT
jgi:hypothetical protein